MYKHNIHETMYAPVRMHYYYFGQMLMIVSNFIDMTFFFIGVILFVKIIVKYMY